MSWYLIINIRHGNTTSDRWNCKHDGIRHVLKTFFLWACAYWLKKIINKKKHKKYNSVSFSLLWEYTSTVTAEYMQSICVWYEWWFCSHYSVLDYGENSNIKCRKSSLHCSKCDPDDHIQVYTQRLVRVEDQSVKRNNLEFLIFLFI